MFNGRIVGPWNFAEAHSIHGCDERLSLTRLNCTSLTDCTVADVNIHLLYVCISFCKIVFNP